MQCPYETHDVWHERDRGQTRGFGSVFTIALRRTTTIDPGRFWKYMDAFTCQQVKKSCSLSRSLLVHIVSSFQPFFPFFTTLSSDHGYSLSLYFLSCLVHIWLLAVAILLLQLAWGFGKQRIERVRWLLDVSWCRHHIQVYPRLVSWTFANPLDSRVGNLNVSFIPCR